MSLIWQEYIQTPEFAEDFKYLQNAFAEGDVEGIAKWLMKLREGEGNNG